MYRRCLTFVLARIYGFGVQLESDKGDVFKLDRKIAEELVLASVFSFVAAADVSAPFLDKLFATDASMQKGAIVQTDWERRGADSVAGW